MQYENILVTETIFTIIGKSSEILLFLFFAHLSLRFPMIFTKSGVWKTFFLFYLKLVFSLIQIIKGLGSLILLVGIKHFSKLEEIEYEYMTK